MNNPTDKHAGIALIVFAVLLLFTMILHPAGGSIAHLVDITGVLVTTHAVAILALPFGWIGFWGLTSKIGMMRFGSMLAFGAASLALVAVMLAAATNGIILPIYLQPYRDATPETIAAIKPILQYGAAVNHAFDYIYTGAFCLAILGWSIEILFTRALPRWMGWFGIVLSVATASIFIGGLAVNSLKGFHIFAACIILWVLITGKVLYDHAYRS
jgi:hypothetical protein